jgi:hypothetical protein
MPSRLNPGRCDEFKMLWMPGLRLLSGRSSNKSPTSSGTLATACESQWTFLVKLRTPPLRLTWTNVNTSL